MELIRRFTRISWNRLPKDFAYHTCDKPMCVSPTGVDCGVRAHCICPNGRVIKHLSGGVLPDEGAFS